jgi:hypothetical protein
MRFLLDLADPEARPRIAARLGLHEGPAPAFAPDPARQVIAAPDTPRSVLRWLLELDDPEANALVYQADVPDAVRRDILLGVPYGPRAAEPGFRVPVSGRLPAETGLRTFHYRSFNRRARLPYHEGYDDDAGAEQRGIISTLYEAGAARQLGRCKRAAGALSSPEWSLVAQADRAETRPGYARWALCVQIACPEELRRQLGGYDPHFRARMAKEGFLLDGLGAYACTAQAPRRVLKVLACIAEVAPHRAAEAADALRPLVESELGDDLEAWAVLAQLLEGFAGSLAELIVTSGAIAAGSG